MTLSLTALTVAIYVLPVIFSLLAGWVVYRKFSFKKDGRRRSKVLLVLGLLFCGYIGASLLTATTIGLICTESSGAGCAFGISFVALPLYWALSITAFLFAWAASGQQAENVNTSAR